MSEPATQTEPQSTRSAEPPRAAGASVASATVVAVIVTWNRREDVLRVLSTIAVQARSAGDLHVIVVENASTDGTAEAIRQIHRPERVLKNTAENGIGLTAKPEPEGDAPRANTAGLASLTLIENDTNLGGCGGFNTGFAAVEHLWGKPGTPEGPDFVWLLDDDIDLPPDALHRLRAAAATDPDIALVGSRTVDLTDRQTTIESTIYFDPGRGMMTPSPPPGHPLEAEHARWTSDPRTLCDVDVVSACSMLVRWSSIAGVGYWDDRFFIYCDDADWCLRVKRAGGRVVCAPDAVVYHTPWTHKLTPTRGYYLHRNLLWMIRRHLSGWALRRATLRWVGRLLRQARSAAQNRRLTEGRIALRTLNDAIDGRGGKLDHPTDAVGLFDAIAELALGRPADLVVLISDRNAYLAAETLRARVTNGLIEAGRASRLPRWRYVASTAMPAIDHGGDSPTRGPGRVEWVRFEPTRIAKLFAQWRFARRRPDAVIVLDGYAEFPLLAGATTLHIADADPALCSREAGGPRALARFAAAWIATAARSVWYGVSVRRSPPSPER
ncbi:MAG: glycosyltransferase family 2 protein [Planctomycetota bacterium]